MSKTKQTIAFAGEMLKLYAGAYLAKTAIVQGLRRCCTVSALEKDPERNDSWPPSIGDHEQRGPYDSAKVQIIN